MTSASIARPFTLARDMFDRPRLHAMRIVMALSTLLLAAMAERAAGVSRTMYMHISKTGGTSICHLARENMERTTSRNCNEPSQLTRDWVGGPREAQLRAAEKMFSEEKYNLTFVATEWGIPFGGVTRMPGVKSLITLREPRDRMVSAYYQERNTLSRHAGLPPTQFISLHKYLEGFVDDHRDNYQTRYLLGMRPMAFGGKPSEQRMPREEWMRRELTREDLDKAIGLLEDADAVFTTEGMGVSDAPLKEFLGWRRVRSARANVRRDKNDAWRTNSTLLSLLGRLSSLDDELYSRAKELEIEAGWKYERLGEPVASRRHSSTRVPH